MEEMEKALFKAVTKIIFIIDQSDIYFPVPVSPRPKEMYSDVLFYPTNNPEPRVIQYGTIHDREKLFSQCSIWSLCLSV